MNTVILLLGICLLVGTSFSNPVVAVEEDVWSETIEANLKVSFALGVQDCCSICVTLFDYLLSPKVHEREWNGL